MREESNWIFGERSLSACIAEKSSNTSKFQLGGDAIWCGMPLSFCTGSTRCNEEGFVTAETGLLHLCYDLQNTNAQTQNKSSTPNAKTISSSNRGTLDAASVFIEQCSNSVCSTEEFRNLDCAGLCWASVICVTATITCTNLSK